MSMKLVVAVHLRNPLPELGNHGPVGPRKARHAERHAFHREVRPQFVNRRKLGLKVRPEFLLKLTELQPFVARFIPVPCVGDGM